MRRSLEEQFGENLPKLGEGPWPYFLEEKRIKRLSEILERVRERFSPFLEAK